MKNPIRRLFETRSLSPNDIWNRGWDLNATHTSKAGKNVTQESALAVSAVWGSVRVLSDGVSTLPMNAYIRNRGVRQGFTRPRWMNFEAGPYRKIDIISQTMTSLLLDGNAYIATYRDGEAKVTFMEVLDPAAVTPLQDEKTREITFEIQKPDGSSDVLGPYDILHIQGMTLPGKLEGLSPISVMRETIGLSMAATEYGGSFFGNGALPGAVVEAAGPVSEAGVKAMRANWMEMHRGVGNAHRLAVLTEGAKFNKISISPNDAQFLETRGFQVNDIARIYGVPVNLLQHSDGPEMGQTLSDKNTHFVQHSIRPWVERIEEAFSWLMWSDGNPRQSFVKFNLDGLLRGDHAQRYATYSQAVTQGILTVNEVRAFEDLPPVPWGDEPISVQVQPQEDEPDSEEEIPDEV